MLVCRKLGVHAHRTSGQSFRNASRRENRNRKTSKQASVCGSGLQPKTTVVGFLLQRTLHIWRWSETRWPQRRSQNHRLPLATSQWADFQAFKFQRSPPRAAERAEDAKQQTFLTVRGPRRVSLSGGAAKVSVA